MPNYASLQEYSASPEVVQWWTTVPEDVKGYYASINPQNPMLAGAEDHYNNIGKAGGAVIGTGAADSGPGGGGAPSGGVGGSLTSLIDPNTQSAAQNALNQGANRASAGGNTNQVQGSQQQGSFNNNSDAASNQQQNTTQNQNQQTTNVGKQVGTNTGTQATTGTSNYSQTGTTSGVSNTSQRETGSTLTNATTAATGRRDVTDTLGLSDLIRSTVSGTQAADDTRRSVLSDIAMTGGSSWQSGVDQAIRQSLSGPGMQGVGDAARSRAAGFAASEAGRKNLDARIQAAMGLGGGSAAGSLVQQAQPLLGETSSNTSNTVSNALTDLTRTGTTSTNETTNTSGVNNTSGNVVTNGSNTLDTSNVGNILSSLTGSTNSTGNQTTANTGSALGSSLGIATGQIPEQKSGGGGGCYVTTMLAIKGHINKADIRAAAEYKLYRRKGRSKFMAIGYSLYGPWLARQLKHSFVEVPLRPIATRILNEELRLAGRSSKFNLGSWGLHFVFHYGSAAIGFVASLFGATCKTRDPEMVALLKQHNLYFEV